MTQLAGRVAIITGASTGIGQGIATAFAAEGAKTVLAARSRDRLQAAAEQIKGSGGTALAAPTDVTDEQAVLALFAKTMEAFGRVDILVNNAGIATRMPTEEVGLKDWQNVMDVNLTGAFLCSREALKIMKQQRSGRIINIGSISAKAPRPNSVPYTTSKFGLEGMTRAFALDGRPYGVAVSILQPGNTATALWDGREEMAQKEGIMSPADLARIAVLMAALPPEINVLESVVLPVTMPFLGRG